MGPVRRAIEAIVAGDLKTIADERSVPAQRDVGLIC